MIRFLTLCAVLAFVTQSAFAEPLEPVKLGPGDELTFRFQGRDSLSGPYVIGVDGQIFFPGIGAVQASGRTVPQVAAELEDRMRETFNLSSRTFSISVSEFRPIYVGGRVKQPGSYTFRPGLRVAHAIAMAGGLKGISGTDPIIALEMGREYTRLRVAEDQLAQALIRREQYLIDLGYDNDASTVVDRAGDLIGAEEAAFRADLQASLSKLSEEIDSVRFDVLEQRAATACRFIVHQTSVNNRQGACVLHSAALVGQPIPQGNVDQVEAYTVSYLKDFMVFFKPGDIVKWHPIGNEEYERISEDVAAGRLSPRIREVDFDLAA